MSTNLGHCHLLILLFSAIISLSTVKDKRGLLGRSIMSSNTYRFYLHVNCVPKNARQKSRRVRQETNLRKLQHGISASIYSLLTPILDVLYSFELFPTYPILPLCPPFFVMSLKQLVSLVYNPPGLTPYPLSKAQMATSIRSLHVWRPYRSGVLWVCGEWRKWARKWARKQPLDCLEGNNFLTFSKVDPQTNHPSSREDVFSF
jgi:hypothetical protein